MINCPICHNGVILPDDEQPQSGTHMYTVVYDCGTEIDCSYGDTKEEISYKCTDSKKITMEESLQSMLIDRKKREFSELTFKIQDFPQTYISMLHEYTGYMLQAMNKSTEYDKKENRIISAPELMAAVMKGCRGSANPMVVQELIKKLHEES
jgi:hypothetical protein